MDTSFEKSKGHDEWLTPPEIVRALGPFDLDPCSPINRPWSTAETHYTVEDDGLMAEWKGRVWCNPPYGNMLDAWLNRCALHRNVTALVFARTETSAFFEHVWPWAKAILFIRGRLRFYKVTGEQGDAAGSPSVLIAYDEANARRLATSGIVGRFVELA